MSQKRGVDHLLEQMIRKERDYLGGLHSNNDHVIAIAQTVSHGGSLDGLVEEAQLQEYRDMAKRLAARNVENERQVKTYVQALRTIRQTQHQQDEEDEAATSAVDYSKVLEKSMSAAQDQIVKDSVQVQQEPMYLKVVEQLREPSAAAGTAPNAEDDEVAFVPTQGRATGTNLKCPLTSMLMENPYRNKVCHHVYEHEAILTHLRKDRQKRCPVAGCANRGITQEQLEKDARTANEIRREKIRQKRAQELERASQDTIDMEDDE